MFVTRTAGTRLEIVMGDYIVTKVIAVGASEFLANNVRREIVKKAHISWNDYGYVFFIPD